MKKKIVWLVMGTFVVVLAGYIAAQQPGDKKDDKEERPETKVVKSYRNLDELSVFRLSDDQRGVYSVRFTASFRELYRGVPKSLSRVRLGRTIVMPGLAFETQGELLCLVPRESRFLLERTANLVRGQKIIIEGTVIPAASGFKAVVVDDIKFSQGEERETKWEILVYWPDQQPKLIKQPGMYTLKLPDPNDKDKHVEFKIEVREVKEFNAEEKK